MYKMMCSVDYDDIDAEFFKRLLYLYTLPFPKESIVDVYSYNSTRSYCLKSKHHDKYCTVKNWRIGIQNMFDRENIDKLSLCAEGNQGKIKEWQLNLWQIEPNSPNFLTIR